jgi:hypothetical protein
VDDDGDRGEQVDRGAAAVPLPAAPTCPYRHPLVGRRSQLSVFGSGVDVGVVVDAAGEQQ